MYNLNCMYYSIKRHKKSKGIKISVKSSGEVVVTIPYFYPKFKAEKFVYEKTDWIKGQLQKLENSKSNKVNTGDYLEDREKAREFVRQRLGELNKNYHFKYNKISIRNQQSRWGSCSSQNNLNFNYRILYLPKELADYLIIHELCHTKEHNHSPRFWKLVAQIFPDHKQLNKQLRKESVRYF